MKLFCLSLLLTVLAMHAQDHSDGKKNPYTTPQDLAAGMKLFQAACAACHGLEGAGGSNGPSLTTGTVKRGGTDEALHATIANGIPGTPMSAFPLKEREVWQLVGHIKELNLRKGAAPTRGDRTRGAQLSAARGCARCHTASEGQGGIIGRDCSQIGSERSQAQLEKAVLDPNAE